MKTTRCAKSMSLCRMVKPVNGTVSLIISVVALIALTALLVVFGSLYRLATLIDTISDKLCERKERRKSRHYGSYDIQ